MSDAYCPDCKQNTVVVFDHAAGDEVCSECGLVLEARSIDEISEWRTFADDSCDPSRVGGSSNPLLADAPLTTVISATSGGSLPSSSVGRWQSHASDPNRSLILAFKTIGTMCDRLELVSTIKDRANEIYKKVEDLKSTKGRYLDAVLAACIFIACRQEGVPRTVKEIRIVANGATDTEIGGAKEFIIKQLELDIGPVHAGDFMRRFCSRLGMTKQATEAALEAVQKSKELDIRRSPTTIAAAVIYMITRISVDKIPLRDISLVTGPSERTIRICYKDLYPYASRLIPTSFANAEDLENLPSS